jgi:hypothetical protein
MPESAMIYAISSVDFIMPQTAYPPLSEALRALRDRTGYVMV